MDWFSWLSKTGLEPSLVYEYGVAFSHNELEESDIEYFNHEFLQSMGISIAKHRLEILKLARKEKRSSGPHPMSRLFVAIKRTKRCLAKYIQTWVRREESALVLVPRRSYSSRWKSSMAKRNKRLMMSKEGRLLLTNGGSPLVMSTGPRVNSFSSPMVHDFRSDEKMDGGDDGYYWSTGVEEIRTGLEPSLVYEYVDAFERNELEEDDITYFNHEFLQSMGISVAKHRLEILKLARKENGFSSRHRMSRLLLAVKRTKRKITQYVRAWFSHKDSALILVPKQHYNSGWVGAKRRRNKRLMMANQGRLMLTNGGPIGMSGLWHDNVSSADDIDLHHDEKMYGNDGGYRSTNVDEIRWDRMFKDLKPT
ncbi:hypothetical protein RJ640_021318 [Escallonia rubra]|uniref:SAM domain-containing protein n=1 Tax=Escallonia rubra TaxID=112253 RepID=A0AA88UHW9_9ASTE|nr:hypothetical protein RJ640_021318 [Escallonia rubra]